MKLRDATPADAARLDELLTKLIHDEAQYDSNLNGSYVVTDNYLDRIGLEGHKLLLIEDEGEIIAFLYGFLYEIPGMFVKPIAILDALYVEEAYRQLIYPINSFAAESGTCHVELKVLSRNETALRLYEKLSFKETKKYMAMDLWEH